MKVLVVNNMAPFLWGGAEELAVHLQRNLLAAGHQSEILRLPFQWEPAHRIPSQMLMARTMALVNVDRVIALKFPAYLIPHPHKTLWLLHQYRQAYDLLQAGQSNLPPTSEGEAIRQTIVAADQEAFRESRKIFVNSPVTQQRLKRHNQFDSVVLPPPLNDPELFKPLPGESYVFAGGRINGMKRQHLLVEAMVHAPAGVKLVVAGPPDTPEDAQRLIDLVKQHHLSDRVHLDLRFLPRHEYADYVNRSNAVAYLPYDEDSLGYVAMEAATASKALITTHDSGGVLGLAIQHETGWVCEPAPKALSEVLTHACQHLARAQQLGEGARARWQRMNITWDHTIGCLLS